MSQSPYPKAVTENLYAALERTQDELRTLIGWLPDLDEVSPDDLSDEDIRKMYADVKRARAMMGRMADGIKSDLELE